jgi:hypothetical protein
MKRPSSGSSFALLAAALALLSSAGCGKEVPVVDAQADESPSSATPLAEVEQLADGCGALRYRGAGSVDCHYRGSLTGDGDVTARSCPNANQISCTYDFGCEFALDSESSSTTCVEDLAGRCATAAPPAAPPPQMRTTFLFNLRQGSTICDPPPGTTPVPELLYQMCNRLRHTARAQALEACQGATTHNSSSTSCCLNCPAEGGPPSCYEILDGGISDAGPDGRLPDGGIPDGGPRDAGAPSDGRLPDGRLLDGGLDGRTDGRLR